MIARLGRFFNVQENFQEVAEAKPAEETNAGGPTPNLSAWFKAFGTPKVKFQSILTLLSKINHSKYSVVNVSIVLDHFETEVYFTS